jgi:hypothetical protein
MPPPQISDDLARAAVAALQAHGGKKRPAAFSLGIDHSTFKNRLLRAAQRGFMGTHPVLEGFEIKQTSAQRDGAGQVEREWVQQRPAPGAEFAMPPGQTLKGVSAFVGPDGRTLHQWIKTKGDAVTPDLVAALAAVFKRYKGRARPAPAPRRPDRELLTVYPIADLHLGMLSWAPETGEDYDLRIAAARLRGKMAELVAQSRRARLAIVLNLGDWQHTDDQRNMTPRSGNQLDVDSRYFKILQVGVQLMIDLIDLALQKHARVIVRNLPGNHDPHVAIALTIALKMFYARDKRVTIDDDPSEFFFYRFGATLIGAHHGHRAKFPDLAMAMAAMRAKEWGATVYRQFFSGHIHHERAREIGAVRVESFQTVAAKDAHAVNSAYVSGQSLVAVTLHKRAGEIGRHRINIPPPAALRA